MSLAEQEAIPLRPSRLVTAIAEDVTVEDREDIRDREDCTDVRTAAKTRHAQCMAPDTVRQGAQGRVQL
jgi:hypothetical protein